MLRLRNEGHFMRNIVLSLATAALLAPAAVFAQEAAPPAPPVEHATVTGDAAEICVHGDAPTGSRFGARKICHSAAEWRTIHANAQASMQYLQDRQDNLVEQNALANGN